MTDYSWVDVNPEITVRHSITVSMPVHVWIELAGWIEGYVYALPESVKKVPAIGNLLTLIIEEINPNSGLPIGVMKAITAPVMLWLRVIGWYTWIPEGCQGMAVLVQIVFENLMTPTALAERTVNEELQKAQREAFMNHVMGRTPDASGGSSDAV